MQLGDQIMAQEQGSPVEAHQYREIGLPEVIRRAYETPGMRRIAA
jgi:GMP synthase-like glutamine amidotransferase